MNRKKIYSPTKFDEKTECVVERKTERGEEGGRERGWESRGMGQK